ncbi:beta-1,3-galactosyltransferase 5-like [Aplochiton taeniatus]
METVSLNIDGTGGISPTRPIQVRFVCRGCPYPGNLIGLVFLTVVTVAVLYTTELLIQHMDGTQLVISNEPDPTRASPGNVKDKGGSPPYHVAYPGDYRFTMDEPCSPAAHSPFLVLIVPVAPENVKARLEIRSTWGNESTVLGKEVRLFFLLGLPSGTWAEQVQEQVRLESRAHRDLLQSDFRDSYFNLTIKSMVMMEWLSSHCRHVAFAMKIDADMFLNVRNLVALLSEPGTPKRRYITGIPRENSNVVRDPTSKWYVPRNVYPGCKFPTYPLGNGYVFSMDLPLKIVAASKKIKAIYIEDAYLGMCSLGDLDGGEENTADDVSLSGEEGGASDPDDSGEGDSSSPRPLTPLYDEASLCITSCHTGPGEVSHP